MKEKTVKIIDLFAGIGGFHLGLSQVEGWQVQCVLASEIDDKLSDLYRKNFPDVEVEGDVTRVTDKTLQNLKSAGIDILCAGFPCQPFSKAGAQEGLNCEKNGNLFESGVLRFIKYCKPKVVFLENVPNLLAHDKGATWEIIQQQLKDQGYEVKHKMISPVQVGVPQVRKRMFIVAMKVPEFPVHWKWPQLKNDEEIELLNVESILEREASVDLQIPVHHARALDLWQEFLDAVKDGPLPSPIWGMEFNATYEYEQKNSQPFNLTVKELEKSTARFGEAAEGSSHIELVKCFPKYAQKPDPFPDWKKRFIKQSREVFEGLQDKLPQRWLDEFKGMPPSLQKFEWNCRGADRTINKHLVQFRGSGIRVKRRKAAPALIAMGSQIPVLPDQKRYFSVSECAKLQGFSHKHLQGLSTLRAHQALGNAVCVDVIREIGESIKSVIQKST